MTRVGRHLARMPSEGVSKKRSLALDQYRDPPGHKCHVPFVLIPFSPAFLCSRLQPRHKWPKKPKLRRFKSPNHVQNSAFPLPMHSSKCHSSHPVHYPKRWRFIRPGISTNSSPNSRRRPGSALVDGRGVIHGFCSAKDRALKRMFTTHRPLPQQWESVHIYIYTSI